MARTAASKVNSADAQEWLESLQQVGEGWYRQLALAVRAGAHTALGMERREFAATVGQRLVDPRAAIVELHKEGHSQRAIAEILGIHAATAHRVLAEEALVDPRPSISGELTEPTSEGQGELPEPDTDALRTEIEHLEIKIKAEQAKRRKETKELRDDLDRLRQNAVDAERKARKEAMDKLTDADRERAQKEAAAFAAQAKEQVLEGLAHLAAGGVVASLDEAGEKLRTMIDQGALNTGAITIIDDAHIAFVEELNVAKASLASGSRR